MLRISTSRAGAFVRMKEKGGEGMRAAAAERKRDMMLARRQRSMVARGSMDIMVGINIGCRRHLRRRWWYRENGDAGEREGGWDDGLQKLEGHWTFSLGLWLYRGSFEVFENYLFKVPFISFIFVLFTQDSDYLKMEKFAWWKKKYLPNNELTD